MGKLYKIGSGVLKTGILLCLLACSSRTEKVGSLLKDVVDLDHVNLSEREPLKSVREVLSEKATDVIEINKDLMPEALDRVNHCKYAVLVVGNHTIVKVTDINDSKMSTSWGVKMPKGEGYIIKKGEMKPVNDYLNFIIGKPDKQSRVLYLFN